jgi:cell division protease FtsH
MERKHWLSIWYFVAAFVAITMIQYWMEARHSETIAYSEFKKLLVAKKVHDVSIGDGVISGKLTAEGLEGLLPAAKLQEMKKGGGGDHPFVTVAVNDPELVADLEKSGAAFGGVAQNKWLSTIISWVLPAVIFFALWSFFAKRMGQAQGGLLAIGKSKARVYLQKQTGVTFQDVAGIDEARDELMEVVDFLKNPERYRKLGGKIPKGVLIVGAPGTGKTLLAKAVAGEAGVPFLSLSGSEFVEMFVGVGAARVRDLFKQAEKMAPSIVFIDELDALGKARGFGSMGGHDEREQTLNQLLVEMDGFDTNSGVIILAATNRPEILDPALLRPGRFDRHVAIDRPDVKGRLAILKVHTRDVPLAEDANLETVAGRTPGFAGADLANLVNEATLLAAKKDRPGVTMGDFEAALDRIVTGLEHKNRVMNPKEKEVVAYHEAGHALVAECRPSADRVTKISIIPRGIAALGYTQQAPTEDRYLLRKTELLERLDVLLGGRVAEELVFHDVSTGAQDDLQRATDMARHMVTQYGMSDALGLATYESPRNQTLLGVQQLPEARVYSESTAQGIDAEINRLLLEAKARVAATLNERRPSLEALAKLLLEKEVVDRAALERLFAPTAMAKS